MVKRLVVGLVIGLFFGAVAAMAAIKGLGIENFTGAGATALAYVLAAVTGALTGLVAGKPFWSADGKIEAGLKAFFGALLAAGGMFAMQKWGAIPVNLDALGAGHGPIGELPAAALPIIGGVLGAIFEVDNTPSDNSAASGKGDGASQPSKAGRKNVRVAAMDDDGDDDAAVSKRSAKR